MESCLSPPPIRLHDVDTYKLTYLGVFAKLRKKKKTVSFVMSVRPSAWNNSAPTGTIFMKFEYLPKIGPFIR